MAYAYWPKFKWFSLQQRRSRKAIPTLANTPIMASVSYNLMEKKDFEGHETIEITEDGEIKLINSTVPLELSLKQIMQNLKLVLGTIWLSVNI